MKRKHSFSDIKKSFQLDLDDFQKLNYDQISYQAENQKAYKSLLNIVDDIIDNELQPDIKPPYKNVIEPVTFINDNQGYILYKKADGTNMVMHLSKENGKWQVEKRQRKQGETMKNDLLWYM